MKPKILADQEMPSSRRRESFNHTILIPLRDESYYSLSYAQTGLANARLSRCNRKS